MHTIGENEAKNPTVEQKPIIAPIIAPCSVVKKLKCFSFTGYLSKTALLLAPTTTSQAVRENASPKVAAQAVPSENECFFAKNPDITPLLQTRLCFKKQLSYG